MTDITLVTDLRDRFGTVRDQGHRPTCLAFAVSDTHAAIRGAWDPLSCEYLFYHAVKRSGGSPHSGTTLVHAFEALEWEGQPRESDWPYLKDVPDDLSAWLPPTGNPELFRRTSETVRPMFNEVWSEVSDGTPIVVAISLSQAFYLVGDTGIIDVSESLDKANRHAVVAVACGHYKECLFLLVRNSWGAAWGIDGHAWLSERYLSPRIVGAAKLNNGS